MSGGGRLLRVRITISSGAVLQTVDVPEAIGPWIARMLGTLELAPGQLFTVEVF